MAVEVSDVDKSIVMAGGVTIANLPQLARNFRRSSSGGVPAPTDRWSWLSGIFFFLPKKFCFLALFNLFNSFQDVNQARSEFPGQRK
jgi:hypothetical protein